MTEYSQASQWVPSGPKLDEKKLTFTECYTNAEKVTDYLFSGYGEQV